MKKRPAKQIGQAALTGAGFAIGAYLVHYALRTAGAPALRTS